MNIIELLKNGLGIHIKEKNKGSFTRWCGGNVTEECIRRGKNSPNPKIRKKATFADNARHFKHKNGGKAFVEGVNVLDSNPKAYKEVKKKYKMRQLGGILDTTSTVINESPITQQRLNWLQKLSEFRKQQDQKALEEKQRQLQKDQETADKVNQYTQMGLEFLNNYMQNKATKNSISDNSHLTSSNYQLNNFWKGQPSISKGNMFNSFNSMNNTSAYFNYSLNQPKI